jgi:hypothetical protein
MLIGLADNGFFNCRLGEPFATWSAGALRKACQPNGRSASSPTLGSSSHIRRKPTTRAFSSRTGPSPGRNCQPPSSSSCETSKIGAVPSVIWRVVMTATFCGSSKGQRSSVVIWGLVCLITVLTSAQMQFVATHNVTPDDVVRATRLGARKVDLFISVVVVLVLVGILAQVLYSFALYLSAVAGASEKLVGLLRFETGETSVAMLSWLSILVTLLLPIFLFYAVRSLTDALQPGRRVRRLMKSSGTIGPTTYTIDDRGVRSVGAQGAETFLPWTSFDGVRSDAEIVVMLSKSRPTFFVPLGAFGGERNEVLAEIRSRISRST